MKIQKRISKIGNNCGGRANNMNHITNVQLSFILQNGDYPHCF